MTTPAPAPLDAERIALAATTALVACGAGNNVELLQPHMEARLRVAPDGTSIEVVDDDGAPRPGVTRLQAARELRKRWPAYFR